MPQDAAQIKERIISFIQSNGPSLPVQIAKQSGLSILFASAFLSELYGDKKIKMSFLRVGSSPLYFMPEHEDQLERFSQFLKSKSKEAYALLKENKILKDTEQQPAIRVALREIKDYAIPFHNDEDLFWRYFLVTEQEVGNYFSDVPAENIKHVEEKEKIEETNLMEEKEEIKTEIKEEPREEIKVKTPKKEKSTNVKKSTKNKKPAKNDKKNENFFNKIKEVLAKKGIEIIDIKDFKNDEAILKVNNKGQEEIIFFYNKKKITDKEILSSFKKVANENLKHSIFFFGEPSKKLDDLISAVRNLSKIDKIE